MRGVFLCPPPEIGETGIVKKSNKPFFGALDVPLQWYKALNEGNLAIAGLRLPYDKCAWMPYAEDNSLWAMLCAHAN